MHRGPDSMVSVVSLIAALKVLGKLLGLTTLSPRRFMAAKMYRIMNQLHVELKRNLDFLWYVDKKQY